MPALDGLRGLAILMVLVFHYFRVPEGDQAHAWLGHLAGIGWLGVDLFFVLSGFLITGILFATRDRPRYLRTFWARRALRIFPLYYCFLGTYLLIVTVLLPNSPEGEILFANQFWLWGYGSNFLNARDGWGATPLSTAHLWSLAIEEQFYLVWPFIVLALHRSALMRVCIILIGASFGLRSFLHVSGDHVAAYVLLFTRMDALAVGSLLYLALQDAKHKRLVCQWARPVASWSLAVLTLAFLIQPGLGNYSFFMQTVGCTLAAIFFAAVIALAVNGPQNAGWGRIGRNRMLQFFGRYSYALYLVHYPMRQVGSAVGLHPQTLVGNGLSPIGAALTFTAFCSILSLVLAMISWRYIEQPMLRLKSLFPYHAPNPALTPLEGRAHTLQ
jgi:peptidoglycan/LPS O-acetylase OafA/YrhL